MIKTEIVRDPKDGSVFIKRYMLWFTKKVCVNVIYKDYEHMHCHPWNYFTLILWGGYTETVISDGQTKTVNRYPGYFTYRNYTEFHKISPLKSKAVTLFFRSGLKSKFSKFLVDGKTLPGAKYWLMQGVDVRKMFDDFKN
jgi:hypothetical protein